MPNDAVVVGWRCKFNGLVFVDFSYRRYTVAISPEGRASLQKRHPRSKAQHIRNRDQQIGIRRKVAVSIIKDLLKLRKLEDRLTNRGKLLLQEP